MLPLEVARKIPGYSAVGVHWVAKRGAGESVKLGRLVGDAASGGIHRLNFDVKAYRDRVEDVYGELKLPQAGDVAEFILAHSQGMHDPTLATADISGAFRKILLTSRAALRGALEVELDDGREVAVIQTSLWFGLTAAPYAWNVVSKTLQRLCPYALFYVDDSLTVLESAEADSKLEHLKGTSCRLLTPGTTGAWCDSKFKRRQKALEFIGWWWDVNNMTVSLTHRSVVKFLARLLHATSQTGVRLRNLQAIASLACRFCTVLSFMKALSATLFRFSGGTRIPTHRRRSNSQMNIVGSRTSGSACWW